MLAAPPDAALIGALGVVPSLASDLARTIGVRRLEDRLAEMLKQIPPEKRRNLVAK